MATNIFPTDYTDKGSADNTDKVWASDGVTNFNITVGEIGDKNFADKNTDNLSEGSTNKYYSDAQVALAPAVTQNASDILLKADITNVITKDSVTAFVPTLGTHPANKDYVDNFSLPDATESIKGKARLATDSEVMAGIDDTTIVTPAKGEMYYRTSFGAGTTFTAAEANAQQLTSSTTLVKVKEIECGAGGEYTITYDAASIQIGGSAGDRNNESQIFKNGVAHGTLNANTREFNDFITYAEVLTFATGDLIQLYARRVDTGDVASATEKMSVKYSITGLTGNTGTVNID